MFKQTSDHPKTELCEHFLKYGSDKCPQIFHSYSPEYFELLKDFKFKFKNILEIGVGTTKIMSPIVGETYQIGASLKAWRDFFVNAQIYGLDIDRSVLFKENRISCYFTDQTKDQELYNTIERIETDENKKIEFDLIIDDGNHIVDDMVRSLNVLHNFLKKDGIYIIEDIKKININIFEKINIAGMKVIKTHVGYSDWDGFVAYQKI